MAAKTLSALDPTYNKKIEKLTAPEKPEYCNELIDRFQKIIKNNKNFLSEKLRKEFLNLITAAQHEIKSLKGIN